jgi:PAN domain
MSNADSIIKLKDLEAEYTTTLQQYNEAYNTYLSDVKNANTDFTTIEGKSYWGEKALDNVITDDPTNCESMCATTPNCTGATFNPVKKYCWMRSGTSDITPGNPNESAIVPKLLEELNTVKGLYEKLMSLQKKIIDEIAKIKPQTSEMNDEYESKKEYLRQQFYEISKEQQHLNENMQHLLTYGEKYDRSYNDAEKQNSWLKLWVIIVCVLIIIIIIIQFKEGSPSFEFIFWFIFIIILILLSSSLSQPGGFFIWFAFIVFIFLFRSGIL